jgi:hypothetical protein
MNGVSAMAKKPEYEIFIVHNNEVVIHAEFDDRKVGELVEQGINALFTPKELEPENHELPEFG